MAGRAQPAWSPRKNGVALRVRLTPGASRDAINGIEELADDTSALRASVRAQPHDGAANEALLALLAKQMSRRKTDLSLTGGRRARLKTILIAGPPGDIVGDLQALFGGSEGASEKT